MRSLLIDTNLLVLLTVGIASRKYIAAHRALKAFSVADYELLIAFIAGARIVFTPNTLSEASNFLKRIGEPARSSIYRTFARLIEAEDEQYVGSRRAAARPEFVRLGLTDSALLEAAGDAHEVVTVDLDLYLAALRAGFIAHNFNHYRFR